MFVQCLCLRTLSPLPEPLLGLVALVLVLFVLDCFGALEVPEEEEEDLTRVVRAEVVRREGDALRRAVLAAFPAAAMESASAAAMESAFKRA